MSSTRAAVGEGGQAVLRLRLSDEGRDRLALFSRTRTPTVVQVMFDRRSMTLANVQGPITEGRVELPLEDRSLEQVSLIAQILRSGALSFEPGELRIAAPKSGARLTSSASP